MIRFLERGVHGVARTNFQLGPVENTGCRLFKVFCAHCSFNFQGFSVELLQELFDSIAVKQFLAIEEIELRERAGRGTVRVSIPVPL